MEPVRDVNAFRQALSLSEDCLKRNYLRQLNQSALAPLPNVLMHADIKLIKIKNIPETSYAELLDTIIPTLDALHHLGASLGYVLHVTPYKSTVYLAIKAPVHCIAAFKLVERALSLGLLSPLIEIIDEEEASHLLTEQLFNSYKVSTLSSIILNTSLSQPKAPTIFSELKPLMSAMKDETFTLFFLADTAQQKQVSSTIYQLESLFTLLDTFKETTFTYNKNLSDSCTNSTNHSDSKTFSHSVAETETRSELRKSECKDFSTLIVNCDINDSIDYVINTQKASSTETHIGNTHSRCATDSDQNSSTHGTSNSETNTQANNTTYCFKGENKTALELLQKTDAMLTRLYASQHLPQFNLGIYITASEACSSLMATFTYVHLIRKYTEPFQESYVTTWDKNDAIFDKLLSCLKTLSHPSFIKNRSGETFTPTTFIDSHYLAHLICTPDTVSSSTFN